MMMRGGMKTINGMAEAGAKAGTIGPLCLGVSTTPSQRTTHDCAVDEDAKLYDDYEFDVLMCKRGSNPCYHCFLFPRLISGLTGQAREHLMIDW